MRTTPSQLEFIGMAIACINEYTARKETNNRRGYTRRLVTRHGLVDVCVTRHRSASYLGTVFMQFHNHVAAAAEFNPHDDPQHPLAISPGRWPLHICRTKTPEEGLQALRYRLTLIGAKRKEAQVGTNDDATDGDT